MKLPPESLDFNSPSIQIRFIDQLNHFSNRRQIDKFHVWLFDCSRQANLSFKTTHLSDEFKSLYGDKIIKAPPLQTIQTWKHFLDEEIVNSPIVLELFVCFLDHLRICDDLTPKMIIPKENECIQATREQILNIPFTEVKSSKQLTLILRLANAWGNLLILKKFYDNEQLDIKFKKYSWYDLNPVHDYYNANVWKAIVDKCLSSEDELANIIFQLMIQKLSFLTKSIYIESDLKIRENCSESIQITVDVILTKLIENPDLINSLDLWKFSTFVPDEHVDKLTQIIVNGIVSCHDEMPFQLSSTISKGCERSTFVLSMIESIIRKFIDDLGDDLPLSKLFVYLEKEQFFKESSELDTKSAKKLSKLISNTLRRDKNVPSSLPAFRTLEIMKLLPLEHLQNETQLKCSILLISLSFTMGFMSDSAQTIIGLVLLILKSDQTLWFFKAYDSTEFFDTLITIVGQQKNIPGLLLDFIETIINRLFKDNPSPEILSMIENISDKVTSGRSLKTTRCLSTLILKSLTIIDCSETELTTELISYLLEILRDSSSHKEYTQIEVNETLLAIMGFFSKRTKLTGKEQKLLKKFTSVCSKSIDDICRSFFNPKNIDEDNFKSNIKFLLFLCSTSHANGLLSTDQLSLIWTSLFPNESSIGEVDDSLANDQNNEEFLSAIPIITKCIFANSTASDLSDRVNYCFNILDSASESGDNQKLLVIYVLKGLISKEWSKNSSKDSRMYQFTDSIMDNLLHAITSTVKNQTFSESVNIKLIQSCGDLIKTILHLGKDLLTSPRLYYCLLVCTFLPLKQLVGSPDQYSKVAAIYHSILSQFLLNFNFMVTSSMVLIKELIQNYLTTLAQISDQSLFTDYDKLIQKDLVNSASDLNKLISQLTNDFAPDFATLSPHLISCYIHLNHSYTVHPFIQKHFTLCMYRLLNVIKSNPNWKDTYDMIHCRLDESGRDLLKILYENYEKFYVFKGRF